MWAAHCGMGVEGMVGVEASEENAQLMDELLKIWLKWPKGGEKTLHSDRFRYRPSPRDFGELMGKQLFLSASCQSVSIDRAEVIIDTVDTLRH